MSEKVSNSQIKGHGEKWTRKKDQAVLAMLTEGTMKEAAEKVGISDTTLWKWSKRPDFQEAYRNARREAVGMAIAKLQHTSTSAVKCLDEVMKDPEAPASAKVSAARCVLEVALRAVELENIEYRLQELEILLAEGGGV